ncbi:hypothetical protein DL766_006052 [Monosporascus sp. MC13-8B]|uniref:methylated diphthine methylhydrolase n=1 Tax=Monosporascus cannonballus TaxID=155416 RepID=A0ABY0GUU1_9PEZI|nr:hypothetical protein DL762_009086 [Monosporascus cannonballus]RYO84921.1 hypothetical protein DL763_007291 [Monosporascus cannonballus]RYP28156.1 hypothetical protein DL766_006052 [Monosporascus sp. MC13-8B]
MAVVSSTGTLSFFELVPPSEGNAATLKEIFLHRPLGEDSGVLFLSCAWHPSLPDLLAITTSNYEVHVLRVDSAWGVSKMRQGSVMTHTLEAWTVAFSPFLTVHHPEANGQDLGQPHSFTILSGGDDSKLLSTACVYHPSHLTDDGEAIQTPYPITTFRGHEAGVTAILPLALRFTDNSFVVVTGSYDDHVRVYRVYSREGGFVTGRPSIVAEKNLEGGVWRLKLIKLEEKGAETSSAGKRRWTALILASCMHAGCRVLEVSGNYEEEHCQIDVMARFEEHKSMNYGSDFQPGPEQQLTGRALRCISTSFYDRLLCLWHFDVAQG